ncbi:MAG: co-chaperone GroES [Bacilli bacterium]|jgi:chaperonin GroES|nr:co-chaperone GroES [Bacilli bacterium]MCH4201852.1 co-chaperone GroES [Bacilli bacterium]MCH4235943.1 co-chaperone GroES [Bacilli bacterium]HMM00661.1 co-chaperone GroES [Bacilli bacterium]
MLKPLSSYVALTLLKDEPKTQSGIILASEAKEKPALGLVKAIGDEVKFVQTGNRVVYESYAGTKVKVDETEYLLIKEENILAIIE